jgi:hypothetical protein
LDLDNLSALNKYGNDGKGVYLTAIDNVTTTPDWFFGETPDSNGALHNSTACAIVIVERPNTKDELDAFYFYFYTWNEGADIEQVVKPMDKLIPDAKPGDHYGNHVGDWEHNMIHFKAGKPMGIWFSQHAFGQACDWADETCLSKQGDRPIVFSARGSHATYPSEGSHIHDEALIDITDKGRIWDPTQPAYYYLYNHSTGTFEAADPTTTHTDWLDFNGAWGDKQYPDTDPRQKIVPYFKLKKYQSGPDGPKFKNLVRNGIMPDTPPRDPMMKKLVRWYLSWYGCCLKGHEPWVVEIVLLLIFVVFIVVVILALRKLGPRVWSLVTSSALIGTRRKQRDHTQDQTDVQLRLLDPEQANEDIDDDVEGDRNRHTRDWDR